MWRNPETVLSCQHSQVSCSPGWLSENAAGFEPLISGCRENRNCDQDTRWVFILSTVYKESLFAYLWATGCLLGTEWLVSYRRHGEGVEVKHPSSLLFSSWHVIGWTSARHHRDPPTEYPLVLGVREGKRMREQRREAWRESQERTEADRGKPWSPSARKGETKLFLPLVHSQADETLALNLLL